MPPRKSDVSKAGIADEETPTKDAGTAGERMSIEDLNLPKSIVTRLAKGVLPPNTQIQGNATTAITKSATVFVNYLASHANENAQSQGRKTIAATDVFKALSDLEFPEFIPRLEAELAKYNEIATFKRNQYRSKVAADKAAGKSVDEEAGDEEEGTENNAVDKDGRPAAKNARRDLNEDSGNDAGGILVDNAGHGDKDGEEEDNEEEKQGDETEPDDEEDDEEELVDQTQLESPHDSQNDHEAEDEALDNGEDSD